MPRLTLPCAAAVALLMGLPSAGPMAAPRLPTDDAQVLERLPTDPRAGELRALRQRVAQQPGDATAAVALARAWFDRAAADGDPRFVAYAQAALAPWWTEPAPPPEVRVMRALVLQFTHRFEAALADLRAAAQAQPDNGEAWSWQAAIHMVEARYDDARTACIRLAPLATPLIATACLAQVDAATGRAATATAALDAALRAAAQADPAEQLWALTRLAETEALRGQPARAEAAFRRALALGLPDVYLLAAYADFLLDQGRAAQVMTLLAAHERSDLLLLRLALAARTLSAPAAPRLQAAVNARLDAARLRADTLHQKEEARWLLAEGRDLPRALTLARENWQLQREAADARVLLEAALAARQPAAAAPVLQWLAASGHEGVVLRRLAARLQAGGT